MNKTPSIQSLLLTATALLAIPSLTFAVTRTQTQDGNYDNTATWGGNPAPIAGDTAAVDIFTLNLNGNRTFDGFTVGGGASTFTLNTTGNLLTFTNRASASSTPLIQYTGGSGNLGAVIFNANLAASGSTSGTTPFSNSRRDTTFNGDITLTSSVVSGTKTDFSFTNDSATNSQGKTTINGQITATSPRRTIFSDNTGNGIFLNNGGNTFADIRLFNGFIYIGASGALGTGNVNFNNSGTDDNGAIGTNNTRLLSNVNGLTIANNLQNISNSRTVTVGSSSAVTGSTTFSGSVTLNRTSQTGAAINSVTLTSGNASATTTFSGLISDAAASNGGTSVNPQMLAVTGPGTVVFSNSTGNTYDGGTTVSSGTLLVNNTSNSGTGTGTVSVSANANLGGAGSIGGVTTVSGNLNAGNGGTTKGVLTFNNSLSLANAQTTTFDLASTARGTGYDGINVAGALTYGGNLSLDIGSAFLANGQTFNLFALSGGQSGFLSKVSLTGSYTATLANDSGNWTGADSSFQYSFSQSSGDFAVTAVPEPSTWIGGGMVLGLAALSQRRRSRTA